MSLRGFALVLISAAAAVAAAGSQALAKENIVARLENPIVLRASAGMTVPLVWTLRDGKRSFGDGCGRYTVFVWLRGRAGAKTTADAVTVGPGRYRSEITIPPGGVRSIRIGVRGWAFVSDARGTRSGDVFFPVANDPTRVPPAPVPVLVYTRGYGNSIVTRVDPLTLARTSPRLRLGGNASSWSYSAGRRYLAVASFPQTLSVIDLARLRVLGRVQLAASGGVVHAVTWTRSGRVLAVVDTPRGALIVAVDPLAGRVAARTQLERPYSYAFARLSDGLGVLLGARGRIMPAQLAVVDGDGHPRTATLAQAPIGRRSSASGDLEQRLPGLAVDPSARRAYLASGERVFAVDLRTLAVSERGPLRTLAKSITGGSRTAAWLGGGQIAISGADYRAGTHTPIGLRVIDVRRETIRTIDPGASSFALAGRLLLVETAVSRRTFRATAYEFDGDVRYRLELDGVTWMKKQGTLGYACRDAFLRAVVDLHTGTLLRQVARPDIRCAELMEGDSRS